MTNYRAIDTETIQNIREHLQDDCPLTLDEQTALHYYLENIGSVLVETGNLIATMFPEVSKENQIKIMDCLEKLAALKVISVH